MLLVRNIFQAKYGHGDELVKLFQEGEHIWADYDPRLLTDASGPFFTVVAELTFADFAEFERAEQAEFSHPDFADWFAKTMPLVESGRREFYRIVNLD